MKFKLTVREGRYSYSEDIDEEDGYEISLLKHKIDLALTRTATTSFSVRVIRRKLKDQTK